MKKYSKIGICLLLIISTLLTVKAESSYAASQTFQDVDAKHRAYNEIEFLAEGGIVQGNKGNFLPKSEVTRAEFVAMLGRALGLNGEKRTTSFKDVSSASFASGLIQSAVEKKIISGFGNGLFKPEKPVTRGEMAIFISRAFQYEFGNSTPGAEQAMLSRGIDVKQSDGTFASGRNALREETAMFLARAINYQLRISPNIAFNTTKIVKVSSNDPLNVRKGPSTKYGIVKKLNNGERVTVAYTVGDWSLIKTADNVIGFVSTAYLVNSGSIGSGSEGNGKSINTLTLVIDPGHGHYHGSAGNGLLEDEVVLGVSLKLKKLLDQTPFKKVYYTRTTDVFVENSERAKLANNVKADIFVSIHANSATASASGTETLYKPGTNQSTTEQERSKGSAQLASTIQDRLVAALGTVDRKTKPRTDLLVLNSTKMPATLVELGFLTNKDDATKLKSESYRQEAAEAIFDGILDYFDQKGYDVADYYKIHS